MLEKNILLIGSVAAAAFLYVTQVNANISACGARGAMISLLNDRFKETRQSYAVDSQNRRLELFANPKNGSWSLLITDHEGRACIVAVGHSFEQTTQT